MNLERSKHRSLAPDINSARALLDGVSERLNGQDWFRRDWLVSVHFFPTTPQLSQSPQSVTMHVTRPHWFNEAGQGIHFEAQFGPKQWDSLEIPLMLHLFHGATIPGTKIKRIAVTKPFVDSTYDLILSWPGYSFRVGKYGTQPFSCTLSLVEYIAASISRSKSRTKAESVFNSDSQLPVKGVSLEEQFETMVSDEILRLCKTLGPAIDKALATALA